MSKLVKNVIVRGVGYGPDFGNADQVPSSVAALIGDHCWDAPPQRGEVATSGSGGGAEASAAAVTVPPSDLDRLDVDELRPLAADAGVKVNQRWGAPRLRDEIRKAAGVEAG